MGEYSTLTRFFYDVAADDSGKFELKDIAPGKYKIFALEKLSAAEFKAPEAAGQLDPLGQEIELAEGAMLEVHPKLIPVERARGALPRKSRFSLFSCFARLRKIAGSANSRQVIGREEMTP
jgi:hypothetical protein